MVVAIYDHWSVVTGVTGGVAPVTGLQDAASRCDAKSESDGNAIGVLQAALAYVTDQP